MNLITFLQRIEAQAEEAESQGLTKLADILSVQLEKCANDENILTQTPPKMEIEASLWSLLIRRAYLHDKKFNAESAQIEFESLSKEIEKSMQNLLK